MQRLLAAIIISSMSTSLTMASDMLPLNDGLYVGDARLCSMSLADMHHAYGDRMGFYTRTINGRDISDNYESGCTTNDVSMDGIDAVADSTCSAEGEEWPAELRFVVPSKDRFTQVFDDSSYDFMRCGSPDTVDTNAPTTTDLVALWHEANGTCRGSSDPDAYLPACGQRDLLDTMLAGRGWCYTQEHWSGADNVWHVCLTALKDID